MSRSSKIFIGILSMLPILAIGIFFVTIFTQLATDWGDADSGPSGVFETLACFS
jgi:hypothetical protein